MIVEDRSIRKPFHLSFQALLDLYLLESIEESDKHAIVSFPDSVINPSGCAHKSFYILITCVWLAALSNLCIKHNVSECI